MVFPFITMFQILRIDSSILSTEAQTFWFMKAVRAKMVMLFLEKEPTVYLTCLRFEILGCKQTGNGNWKQKHPGGSYVSALMPYMFDDENTSQYNRVFYNYNLVFFFLWRKNIFELFLLNVAQYVLYCKMFKQYTSVCRANQQVNCCLDLHHSFNDAQL